MQFLASSSVRLLPCTLWLAPQRLTTLCQKILSGLCLTTGYRHCRLERGARLLPVIKHPPMPCSMTVCRQSPPKRTLNGTLSASTCCRACLTTSGGDHAGTAPGTRRQKPSQAVLNNCPSSSPSWDDARRPYVACARHRQVLDRRALSSTAGTRAWRRCVRFAPAFRRG